MLLDQFIHALTTNTLDKKSQFLSIRRVDDTIQVVSLPLVGEHKMVRFVWGTHTCFLVDDDDILNKYIVPDPTNPETTMTVMYPAINLVASERRYSFLPSGSNVRYPQDVVDMFNLNNYALNAFRVQSYHASNARTNDGHVSQENFMHMKDETLSTDHFGFELEACLENGSESVIDTFDKFFSPVCNSDAFEHFEVCTDGSLRNGLEMVSLPMSYAYVHHRRDMFNKIYTWLREKHIYGNGSSMHIHFPKTYFIMNRHELQERFNDLIMWFWRKEWAFDALNIVVGREATGYCRVSHCEWGQCDHSNWVSGGRNTIEIRRFGANINFDDLLNKFDFALGMLNIIRNGIMSGLSDDLIKKGLDIHLYKHLLTKLNIVTTAIDAYTNYFRNIFNFPIREITNKTNIANITTHITNVETEVTNLLITDSLKIQVNSINNH